MIKTQLQFTNPNLPIYSPFSERIAAISGLSAWYQGQSDFTQLSENRISAFIDRLGRGPNFTQSNDSKRADLVAPQLPSGDSAAVFRRDDITVYQAASEFDLSADAAFIIIWRPDTDDLAQSPLSKFQNSTNRWCLLVPGNADNRVQALLSTSVINLTAYPGEFNMTTIEKTSTQHRGRSAGITSGWSSHDNALGTGLLTFGSLHASNSQALEGAISDIFVFAGRTVLDSDDYSIIASYAAIRYGLDPSKL